MTKDAELLYLYIKDKSKDTTARVISIQINELKEIIDPETKIKRLLEEIKNQNLIEEFTLSEDNEVEVNLIAKKSSEISKIGIKQADLENSFSVDIHRMVMDKFIKKRFKTLKMNPEIFNSYSELFKPFIYIKNDDSETEDVDNYFQFIADKVDETDGENYIKVLGPDGTGKSSFLSILYLFLYDRFCRKLLKEYPFYINLHYYDRNVIEGNSIEEVNSVVRERMQEDLSGLIHFSKACPNTNFLIIIDGNDKYDRTHLGSSIILEKILNEIKGHKKIICLGEKTNVHFYRERNSTTYIDNVTTYTFHFSPIYISERSKWENVIDRFCHIYHNKRQIANICTCINNFRIKEIDYNLLTIFCDTSKRTELDNIFSISDLYSKYCLEYLGKDNKKLKVSISLAYKYFMTKDFIDQKYIASHWREWELVHQHKTISNYLLALYYSNLVFEGKAENVKSFECVFTNGINIFLKSIINETTENQQKTLSFCRIMFENGDYRVRAQAAYLAGRIKVSNLQEQAVELLSEQLDLSRNKIISRRKKKNMTPKERKKEYFERKKEYFVKRSILVSLLYLEECPAGKEFIQDLFDEPLMNEVNRAFYLQYYGDTTTAPEEVNLRDDGKCDIGYTTSVLFNYIDCQLNTNEPEWSPKNRFDFQIYMFTLCSLIQKRLEIKKQCEDAEKLYVIIEKALNIVNNNLEENMRIYLEVLLKDIKSKTYNIGHLYDELYSLKEVQRRGWLERIEKGSIHEDRYENVIEHTYYCWLLGMLYLPDSAPQGDYKNYNKKKILDCLLIHDLAEKYIGDILPEESNTNIRQQEKDYMHYIFMHDMYSGIGNMKPYEVLWDEFGLDSKDINGKLAKEIDIIQSIYQFCIYKRKGAIFPEWKERDWKREQDNIKTSLGKSILREVVLNKFQDILS